MSKGIVKTTNVNVAVAREVDGLEMGVLSDGRAYLSGRALSRLTDTAYSTLIEQSQRWLEGKRDNKLAQLLVSRGLNPDSLYVEVERPDVIGGKVHAYTEEIAMTILEYYAYEAPRPKAKALENYRKLATASLRYFVYRAVGYDPENRIPSELRQFHARLTTHGVPQGHFSVFRELVEFMVVCMQRGLPCDHHTVPDISVGQTWAKYWVDNNLDAQHGPRKRHEHNYPDDFPQSKSNPQDIWIYPLAAVPAFREWLMRTYVPEKFPNYLRGKLKQGVLPPSTVELLLAEVVTPQLESST